MSVTNLDQAARCYNTFQAAEKASRSSLDGPIEVSLKRVDTVVGNEVVPVYFLHLVSKSARIGETVVRELRTIEAMSSEPVAVFAEMKAEMKKRGVEFAKRKRFIPR